MTMFASKVHEIPTEEDLAVHEEMEASVTYEVELDAAR